MPPEQPYLPHEHFPDHAKEDAGARQREQEARILCQTGDYRAILEGLHSPSGTHILNEQVQRLQSDAQLLRELQSIKGELSQSHWELLAFIELFDEETFHHCLRTYQIIDRKLQSDHAVGHFLRAALEEEGISPRTLKIAALLHDVGKIGLPFKDLLLNNTLTDTQWRAHGIRFFADQNDCSDEEAEKYLDVELNSGGAHNRRAKDIVPISYCLTAEQSELLKRSGIDPSLPLGEVINRHQDFSGDIAQRYHLDDTLVALVSNHHERPLHEAPEPHPISQSALRIANILRLADVLDAIHAARAYKKGNPFLTTTAILVDQAHAGFIDIDLTRRWIDEDMQIFHGAYTNYFAHLPEAIDTEYAGDPTYTEATREAILQKELRSLEHIEAFLSEPFPTVTIS